MFGSNVVFSPVSFATVPAGNVAMMRCGLKDEHNERVRKGVLQQILSGASDANIRFDDLRSLLTKLGFAERVRGGHHIFSKNEVTEILNLQPRSSFAKPYQVKQVRNVIVQYKLAEGIK